MGKRIIRFCRHAKLKFKILRLHRFPVTDLQVRQTVLDPDRTMAGYGGRKVAERKLGKEHALRVVYEERAGEIEVITFYPVRRRP